MTTPWRDGPRPEGADGAAQRPEQEGAARPGVELGPADSGHGHGHGHKHDHGHGHKHEQEHGHEHETGGGAQEAGAPRTGLDAVDRVLAREDEISRLPVTERAAAYEDLHRELERILSEDPGKLPPGLVAAPGGWPQR